MKLFMSYAIYSLSFVSIIFASGLKADKAIIQGKNKTNKNSEINLERVQSVRSEKAALDKSLSAKMLKNARIKHKLNGDIKLKYHKQILDLINSKYIESNISNVVTEDKTSKKPVTLNNSLQQEYLDVLESLNTKVISTNKNSNLNTRLPLSVRQSINRVKTNSLKRGAK